MPRQLAIGSVPLAVGTPRIVAAGGAADVDALTATADADLIELRADLWDEPSPAALPTLLSRLGAAGRPVILTVRAPAEGGRALEESLRRELYLAGLPHAAALDVEIASVALVAELAPRAHAAGVVLMLSAHTLETMPPADALIALIERGERLGADLVKLAAHARDVAELRTLVSVTLAAAERGVVTLALGPAGPLSRVLLPAAGSLLTYGHVGRPTAPSGQLPVSELAALVRRLYPKNSRV